MFQGGELDSKSDWLSSILRVYAVMNKKDYKLIAHALKNSKPIKKGFGRGYAGAVLSWCITVRHMAFFLRRYKTFNEEEFFVDTTING
jgi:hypothetical protein